MREWPETNESMILRVKDPADAAAWSAFLAIYRPVVWRMARNRGLQNADADDLAQQVFMAVSQAIEGWELSVGKPPFRVWLTRIARNDIVNALTRQKPDAAVGSTSVQELLNEAPERDNETTKTLVEESRMQSLRWAAAEIQGEFTESTWAMFWQTSIEGLPVAVVPAYARCLHFTLWLSCSPDANPLSRLHGLPLRELPRAVRFLKSMSFAAARRTVTIFCGGQQMKLLTAVLLLILTTVATSAQDTQPSSEVLAKIVDGAEKNLDAIDTFVALYQVRSISRHQTPRDGQVHFSWRPKPNYVRSQFVSSPANVEAASPQGSHAVSPEILFGDGHRLLVDRFRDYLALPETNERVEITSSVEGENLTYTIRIAYTNDSEEKLFVTWKISKKHGFNPLLVVSSLGVSPETAELRTVSSWTYRKVHAISVPEHVAISRFERITGELTSTLTLDLLNVELNDPDSADALDPQRELVTPQHDTTSE